MNPSTSHSNYICTSQVKLYPRTSIDGSRRVRQLAHTLQGQISISCGKRMGRHMTTVVASWVSGQYDNDKLVNRAATDSFQLVFATEVKRKNVWRLYQASLAEYSRHVVVKESANTLSDERTTSPDDASAKYSSVVGAAITTLTNLIGMCIIFSIPNRILLILLTYHRNRPNS